MGLLKAKSSKYSYIKLSIEETHKYTLNLAKRIIDIINDNGLRYWVTYGTLLGAIRHKGFIPWDDDFDIGMPREDYNKLLEIFDSDRNRYYPITLHNKYTNKYCFYNISRVCDERFYLKFDGHKYHSGLFIDIYPFDGMGNSDDLKYWNHYFSNYHKFMKCAYLSESIGLFGRTKLNKILNIPMLLLAKIHGNRYYLDKLDQYKKFDLYDSKYAGVPCWEPFVHTNCYTELIELPFEDFTVMVPRNYDLLLRESYGDYMKLPPEEQRKPQHGYIAYRRIRNE